MDESHPLAPVDINGINKLAGENYHLLYHRLYGLKAAALRLTNTYGPRMRVKDARQTFIGALAARLVEGKPFEVWDGAQLRDFTYVDDAVEALLLAACHPRRQGEAFNLGGGGAVSLKDLADKLVAVQWRRQIRAASNSRPSASASTSAIIRPTTGAFAPPPAGSRACPWPRG